MASAHTYELVAQEVADWVARRSKDVANGLREDGRAPFAANLTEPQKLAHFERMLYHPDGTENSLGHERLMKMLGTNDVGLREYARVKAAVLKARAERVAPRTQSEPLPDVTDEG